MKHVLKEYPGSDLVLNEYITANGSQVLHLYIRYHDGRQNYTVSFETLLKHCERIKMKYVYTDKHWQDFLKTNQKPTTVEVLMHLGQWGVRAKCFTEVKFDKIELDVVAKWEDTSFTHDWNGGGVEQQGYWEVFEIFYNDTMLPLALISDETIQKLLDLINQPKGRA